MSKDKRRKTPSGQITVFKDKPVPKDETNPETLAESICVNLLFMGGDDEALIHHMQFDHGFSFEQLDLGINEIRRVTGDCFEEWEQYFTFEHSKPIEENIGQNVTRI